MTRKHKELLAANNDDDVLGDAWSYCSNFVKRSDEAPNVPGMTAYDRDRLMAPSAGLVYSGLVMAYLDRLVTG